MNETFGQRLQRLAISKKKYQIDLVASLGKHSSTISKWWNGEIVPGAKNVRLIADYFGCDPEWLASGEGEPYPQPKTETVEYAEEFERRKSDKILNNKLVRMEKAVFKTQCPGYLDELFEFIADKYGADKEGAEKFLKDLYKDNLKYRLWNTENKLAKNGCEAIPVEKIKAKKI